MFLLEKSLKSFEFIESEEGRQSTTPPPVYICTMSNILQNFGVLTLQALLFLYRELIVLLFLYRELIVYQTKSLNRLGRGL